MKSIIIIGSGVRECAILMKLLDCKDSKEYNFHTIGILENPYMYLKSNFIKVKDLNYDTLIQLNIFNSNDIDFVFIGSEDTISMGISDFLKSKNIFCIAPEKEMSLIETSKIFTRNLLGTSMNKYNPKFTIIEKGCIDLLEKEIKLPYKKVIKKDGLCGGKGVYVEDVHFDDKNLPLLLLPELVEYNKTNRIIIEEKLEGLEFSLMSFVDVNGNLLHLKPVFDYKRLDNGDQGPNTGSMGSVILKDDTLNKFIPKQFVLEAQKINEDIIKKLNTDKIAKYKGVIYGSYMLCNYSHLKVIEFNCRFGDPEGALALYSFKNSLIDIFKGIKEGNLNKINLDFKKEQNFIGVYCVPESYPQKTKEKYDIYFRDNMKTINEKILFKNVSVMPDTLTLLYGSCEISDNHLYTGPSRTMLLVSQDNLLYRAKSNLYNNIDDIISSVKYRNDIGSKFISKYENAGVSIDNSNNLLKGIKLLVKNTYNKNVCGKFGDFGGSFKLGSRELVSSIDGVGTKTDFVEKYFQDIDFYSLGIDIVNHSINDILVMGAEPLFFLDYYGCNNLNKKKFFFIIQGITDSLKKYSIPLIGGETAEMPITYKRDSIDIVGCIIGEKTNFINFPRQCRQGDIIVSVESDGPHTNGFSLINSIDWNRKIKNKNILAIFLNNLKKPHKEYYSFVKYFISIYGKDSIIKMCHNTGGGLLENLNRVVGDNKIILDHNILDIIYPNWCKIVENITETNRNEMRRIYNCGVGFSLIISPEIYQKVIIEKRIKVFKIGILN